MKRLILLLVLTNIVGNICSAQSIWGGYTIPITDAPYQVSVRFLDPSSPRHVCGGSILSDRWILTAAHTFYMLGYPAASDFVIRAGTNDCTLGNTTGQTIAVDDIIIYPNYGTNPYYIDDVALLHLAQPLTFNNDVQPIPYASNCNTTVADVSPGISSFITGWGSLVYNQSGSSQYLQATNLTIIPNPAPSQYLNAIALYDPASGSGPGDSGGPAVITKNGKKIQIGICSGGSNWANYMDVRSYASWILSITGLGNPNPPTDLYMKDRPEDLGFEPNTVSASMWSSEDIWVRNQQDGIQIQVHENPEYYANSNNHNHVYVRIRHRGCQETDYYTMKQVTLYWAKAGSALNWPSSWDGSQTYNNHPLGGVIGSVIIPSLQPGQETICRVQWDAPNPAWYVGYSPTPPSNLIIEESQHHFCILARIELPFQFYFICAI